MFHDITERKRAEQQIHHHGAPRRVDRPAQSASCCTTACDALALGAPAQRAVALLLLDLDDFKGVNDTLGHFTGDDLLVAVAQRITDCIREDRHLARLGGDEFAMVLRSGRRSAAERRSVARSA